MTLTRTLWNILDSREEIPSVVDTQDPDVEGAYFGAERSRFRWKIGITAGIALAGAVAIVVVGAFFFRTASPAAEPVDDLVPSAPGMETPPTVETTELVVHVVGAVVRPGVVRLPEFSRVEDALAQAGGPTAEAQLSGVNLAREIFDGEQIVVPVWGQEVSAATGSGLGPISLSRADQAALETLPRVGPATAQRIIAWRESNGPFRSVEDLLAVSGIGPATLEGLADLVVP